MRKKMHESEIIEMINKGMSLSEISRHVGYSLASVSLFCKKHNIVPNRYKLLKKSGEWDNYNYLYAQYVTKQRSISNIAAEAGISKSRMRKRLLDYNIALRSPGDGTRIRKEDISNNMRKLWRKPRYIDKWMRARSDVWQRPEYRHIFSKLMAQRWEDKQYADMMKLQSQRLHRDPEYIKKRLNSLRGKNKSKIEDVFAYFLSEVGIRHNRHVLIGSGIQAREFDFQLYDGRLVEIDGSYWHTIPHVKANDQYKDKLAQKEGLGLIRVSEDTFYSTDLFGDLCQSIGLSYEPSHVSIREIKIDHDATVDECNDFFRLYHYLHNCGRYGMTMRFSNGPNTIAMVIVAHPIRKESATSIGKSVHEVKEISRMAISARYYNKNLGSWMLGQVKKELRGKATTIIAYSDPAVGHSGGVYKAAGFEECGNTPTDYWYETNDGIVIHKKTLYNRAKSAQMKETEYAALHDYKRFYYPGKVKFKIDI